MINLIELLANRLVYVGLIGLVTLFIYFVRWKQSYWKRQNVVGPKPVFLLGNTLLNAGKPVIRISWDNYRKFGPVYGFYDGLTPHIVVGQPKMLKQMLVKDFHLLPQGMNTVYRHQVEDNFLILVYGEKWKRMRTLLSPTFSSGKLKKMFNLMKVCTLDAQSQLTKLTQPGGGDDDLGTNGIFEFDPKYFWGRYNMDVIAKCCFATSLDVYNDTENIFLQNFIQFFKGMPLRLLFLTAAPSWLIRLLKVGFFRPVNLEFFGDLTLALIEKRKNSGEGGADDFLQLLIDSEVATDEDGGNDEKVNLGEKGLKAKLTVEEIVGSSVIFLVAGYETTSTLLTWACYRLATNPEIQEKLFDEVSKSDIGDYDTLGNLSYLDAIISETLRIDPPIVLFQRVAHDDYTLPETNVQIPKGTVFSIPVYAMHHDSNLWPEPEVFNPDRFLSNEKIEPFAWLPFGGGPRTCIGMRFALINAKLSLATLVRDYQICTTEKTPLNLDYAIGTIILTVEHLKLGLKPRSK